MNFIKELFDYMATAGTVGAYAMVSVMLIIIGYFKHLKPFLTEFYSLKTSIQGVSITHTEASEKLRAIKEKIEKLEVSIESDIEDLTSEIEKQHDTYQVETMNKINSLEKELTTLIQRSEKIKSFNEQFHTEVMIEMVKLQTKVEYLNPNLVKGLQK